MRARGFVKNCLIAGCVVAILVGLGSAGAAFYLYNKASSIVIMDQTRVSKLAELGPGSARVDFFGDSPEPRESFRFS